MKNFISRGLQSNKSFAGKKRSSRGVSANTAGFLRFFSSETLPFLAPDGITEFGIALAQGFSNYGSRPHLGREM